MNKITKSNLKKVAPFYISRRGFIVGGIASLAGAVVLSPGCSGLGNDEVINVGFANCAENFDLSKNSSSLIVSAGWHTTDSLYNYDSKSGEIYPGVAKSDPKKIADLIYDVEINNNLKFSDGQNITIEDVQNAVNVASTYATHTSFFDFVNKVEMLKDTNSIRLYLNYDIGDLLKARLSLVGVYKTAVIDGEQCIWGTGPWDYKSGDGSDGSSIEYVPCPYYQGKYPAKDKKMVWKIITDDDERTQAALEGKIDVLERANPSSFSELKDKGWEVENLESSCMPTLIFNTVSSPFNDVRVRQAILYAVNTNKILTDLLFGYGDFATSIVPEHNKYYARAKNVYLYNVAKARQLLNEVGISRFKFDLINFGGYWGKLISAQIVSDLNTVGITCNVREADGDWRDLSPDTEETNFEVGLIRIDPSYFGDDPDLIIQILWGEGIGDRITRWSQSSPTQHKQLLNLAQLARTSSGDLRMDYWKQCYDIISENVSAYPLFFRNIATAWNPKRIENFTPIPCDGISLLGANLLH